MEVFSQWEYFSSDDFNSNHTIKKTTEQQALSVRAGIQMQYTVSEYIDRNNLTVQVKAAYGLTGKGNKIIKQRNRVFFAST